MSWVFDVGVGLVSGGWGCLRRGGWGVGCVGCWMVGCVLWR